jgi:tetratricopeptide (TPR) repeat protein
MKFPLWKSVLALLLVFLAGACAADKQARIRQGEASRNLGEAFMQEGNYTAALKELLRAEELNPDDPYLQNDLGLTYLAKERHDLAIQHFKKAIRADPDYAPAQNNLGTAYLAKGDWDAAIATLSQLTQDLLYATPHFPLTNLGFAYYNKKNYEMAERYYKEALDLQPRYVIALRGLGRTYLAQRRIPQAIETLEKAADLAPRFPALYLDLARAYAAAANDEAALDAYRKVMALAPDSDMAEEAERAAGALPLNRGQ